MAAILCCDNLFPGQVINLVELRAVCCMADLLPLAPGEAASEPPKWTLREVLPDCPSVEAVIGMDCTAEQVRQGLGAADDDTLACSSVLEMVAAEDPLGLEPRCCEGALTQS